MPALRQIKLYNSGSFFDPRAVPPEDHEAIAQRVAAFDRVIVECHPALIGESTLKFRDWLGGTACSRPISGEFMDGATPSLPDEKLEVAMGLETAHPQVLEKLNKRMTLDQFRRAAEFLRENGIALRVFILVKPPFLDETEALLWARRSIDFAFDCGATVASLIPTRFGNGALEMLAERGEFSPPKLATLEAALDYGVGLNRGRVFADLWDLETFSDCAECFEQRRTRLLEMNLRQVVLPRVPCVSGFGRPSGTGICDND
ncbi:MAG: radical SAM protein [Verrucomicrobia bacterium]|nr:MAG: radical SAM protein [Verrucomicrobiota bacterium]